MPSSSPSWTPTYDFSQGGYSGTALKAQLDLLAAYLADQEAALDDAIRADDTLSDGIVRLRNLHAEVKDALAGLNYLEGVAAVATSNQATAGLLTIDGVTLSAGDRVLLTAQTAPTENGVWVAASGTWAQAETAAESDVVTALGGDAYVGTRWLFFGGTSWKRVDGRTWPLPTAALADLSVTTAKIAAEAVTTAKIDDEAVTTAKIDDEAVTTAKIADSAISPVMKAVLDEPTLALARAAMGPWGDAQVTATTDLPTPGTAITGAVARRSSDRDGDVINVKDFGVKGDNSTDDTAAIQAVLDAHPSARIWFPYGLYRVSQITISGLGRHIDFDQALLVANASTAKTSVVQIKCGLSLIRNLKVAGVQNLNYDCGVHWYTNDLNTHYPGRNRIDGLFVTECQIGLVIGALPGQVDPIPAQGTVQADGTATDAPLSECYIHGLKTPDCIVGLYMRQPNGKMQLVAPDLVGEDNAWTSYATRSNTCAFTIASAGSELTIIGGDVEQIQQTDGLLFQVGQGSVNMYGTCLEAVAPAYIGGNGMVRLQSIQNLGNNNPARPVFEVDDDCEGILQLSDMRITLQDGSTQSLVKCTASLGDSFSPAKKFRVECDGVEFYNFSMAWPTPLVDGAPSILTRCSRSVYTAGVRSELKVLHETGDVLGAVVDATADQIAAHPQAVGGTSGGWVFACGGAGSTWGRYATGLPTVESDPVTAAVRLTTTGATTTATSPAFPISSGKDVIIKGWFKSGTAPQVVLMRILWFKFDGTTPSATAQSDVFSGTEDVTIGATWRPLMIRLTPPGDAAKAKVFVYAETGADLQFANLRVQ